MKPIDKSFESSRKVALPGLDLEMELPPRVELRYDGAVSSLVENIARTELEIKSVAGTERPRLQKILDWPSDQMHLSAMMNVIREKRPDLKNLAAYCFPHRSRGKDIYVIAKGSWLDKSASIFADGHESAEFLDEIKNTELLQKALDVAGIELDCKKYRGEDFADIGGMLALVLAQRKGVTGLSIPKFKTREAVLPEIAAAFKDSFLEVQPETVEGLLGYFKRLLGPVKEPELNKSLLKEIGEGFKQFLKRETHRIETSVTRSLHEKFIMSQSEQGRVDLFDQFVSSEYPQVYAEMKDSPRVRLTVMAACGFRENKGI